MTNKQPPAKQLSPELAAALHRFFTTHRAASVGKNLRCMLLDYLACELRIGVPFYLDELLWQLSELFELLELAEQETAFWHVLPNPKKHKKK